MTNSDGHKVAQELLAYIRGCGHTGDTLEGVARWWLMRQLLGEHLLLVRQALDELKANGHIRETITLDNRTLYFSPEDE
ncbi:MAG: hypothetical protein QOH51_1248 [Acidobacteriota bacterium]|jgi:hypothetical protein|nr:hypothetical protein [Acidobacteriota bacterium]